MGANASEGQRLAFKDLFIRIDKIEATPSLSADASSCVVSGKAASFQATTASSPPTDFTLLEGQTASFSGASITLRSVQADAAPEYSGACSLAGKRASFTLTAPAPTRVSLTEGGSFEYANGNKVEVISIRKTIGAASLNKSDAVLLKNSTLFITNGSVRVFLPVQNFSTAIAVSMNREILSKYDTVSIAGETIEVKGFSIGLSDPLYPDWSCNVLNASVTLELASYAGTHQVQLKEKESYPSPGGAFVRVEKIYEIVNPGQNGCTVIEERAEIIYSSTVPCRTQDPQAYIDVIPFGRAPTTYVVRKGQSINLAADQPLLITGIEPSFYVNSSTGTCILSPESISLEYTSPSAACPISDKSALVRITSPLSSQTNSLSEGGSISLGSGFSASVDSIDILASTPSLGACSTLNQSASLSIYSPEAQPIELAEGESFNESGFSFSFLSGNASLSPQAGSCLVSNASALIRLISQNQTAEESFAEGKQLALADGVLLKLDSLSYSTTPPGLSCEIKSKQASFDILYPG